MIFYNQFENLNEQFCNQLPRKFVPLTNESVDTSGVEKYSRSRRSNVISLNPMLSGSFQFSKQHTGRNLLYTMIDIVNARSKFTVGKYFCFLTKSNSTPDVVLLANPTQRQPGNGVICLAGDNQPKSWDNLMSLLTSYNVKSFTTFFKRFMTQSICTEGPTYFTEIAFLLLFEIARRLVRNSPSRFSQHKERLDKIPVAACIAVCLADKVNDIRKCRDVFGHRKDGNYPKKICVREEAASAILERYKIDSRDDYEPLMKQLFLPDDEITFLGQQYYRNLALGR